MSRRCWWVIPYVTLLVNGSILAEEQSARSSLGTVSASQTHRATIEPDLFASTRSPAMGFFAAPFADGLDAALSNPAGIGGLAQSKKSALSVTQFHFPYAATSFNSTSQSLGSEMINAGGATNLVLKESIDGAVENGSQFARNSAVTDVGIGRLLLTPFWDQQLATVQILDGSDTIELLYQERYGIGGGFSFKDPTETFYLGIYAGHSSISRTQGYFTQAEIDVADESGEDPFQGSDLSYSGTDLHAGLIYRISKKASPVISATIKHVSTTDYKSSTAATEPLTDKEQVNLGIGYSPEIKSWLYFNFAAGMNDITDIDQSLSEKWRSSMELNLGRNGAYAVSGLRLGGNSLGLSYGAHVNIGFISVQYASFPSNLGVAGGDKQIERRQAAVVAVDLAE